MMEFVVFVKLFNSRESRPRGVLKYVDIKQRAERHYSTDPWGQSTHPSISDTAPILLPYLEAGQTVSTLPSRQ